MNHLKCKVRTVDYWEMFNILNDLMEQQKMLSNKKRDVFNREEMETILGNLLEHLKVVDDEF